MERYEYSELKQNIREDYARYTTGGYNFSFYGVTSKILDDMQRIIWESDVEGLMIYTVLAQVGLEQGELRPEIKVEVQRIINTGALSKFKDELSYSEFDIISQDLIKIKESISK